MTEALAIYKGKVEKNSDKMNAPNQEPLDHEKTNEPNQEPLDHEKTNEPNKEPMNNDKNNEPNQEPLEHDKSADQLGSSTNFVKKIENVVKNVASYLQSNGSRAFIRGRTEIDPENNTDANTGEGQHSTNGPNAKDEMDLLKMIHITKKQIDKKLQCTVCLDEYELGKEAMELTCGHIFHEGCITHWIIMHDTCPVCRRYFCHGELHLPKQRVSLFRPIVRRVCRTICSPLFYFFPSLRLAQAMNDRRREIRIYRLVRAKPVTSPQEPAQSASAEMIDDYIFCQGMLALHKALDEQYAGSSNTITANMRRRFSRLHREANANPAAADENPPPQRPEFRAGENPTPQRPEFHAGAENPPAERPEFPLPPNFLSMVHLDHY